MRWTPTVSVAPAPAGASQWPRSSRCPGPPRPGQPCHQESCPVGVAVIPHARGIGWFEVLAAGQLSVVGRGFCCQGR